MNAKSVIVVKKILLSDYVLGNHTGFLKLFCVVAGLFIFSVVLTYNELQAWIFNFKTCTVFLSVSCEWILQHGARTHTEPVQFEENN